MSRDRRGNGVQVVGGSNPPCPTRFLPQYTLNMLAYGAYQAARKLIGQLPANFKPHFVIC